MTMQDKPTSDTAPALAKSERTALRAAAGTLLLGGLVWLVGVSRPVVRSWADAWDDEAKRIALVQAQSGQFRLGFVFMGIGFIMFGLALAMWGRSVARLENGRRITIATATGALAAIGGSVAGVSAIVRPFVDLDGAAVGTGWGGAVGVVGLTLGFIVFGVLAWRGPAPKWAGVFLALMGLAGAVMIPAFYMFGAIGFGAVGVIHFRRGWTPSVT